jgi:amino acid transporter
LSINVAHIRFRMAWKAQGHHVDELPFRALGGIWGSVFGATVLVLVLIAQFYIAVAPIGGTAGGGEAVEAFFLSYLALPVVLVFYIGGWLWKRSGPKKASEIDLVSRCCNDLRAQE